MTAKQTITEMFTELVNDLEIGEFDAIDFTCVERTPNGYVVSNNGWGELVESCTTAIDVAVADWLEDNL